MHPGVRQWQQPNGIGSLGTFSSPFPGFVQLDEFKLKPILEPEMSSFPNENRRAITLGVHHMLGPIPTIAVDKIRAIHSNLLARDAILVLAVGMKRETDLASELLNLPSGLPLLEFDPGPQFALGIEPLTLEETRPAFVFRRP